MQKMTCSPNQKYIKFDIQKQNMLNEPSLSLQREQIHSLPYIYYAYISFHKANMFF